MGYDTDNEMEDNTKNIFEKLEKEEKEREEKEKEEREKEREEKEKKEFEEMLKLRELAEEKNVEASYANEFVESRVDGVSKIDNARNWNNRKETFKNKVHIEETADGYVSHQTNLTPEERQQERIWQEKTEVYNIEKLTKDIEKLNEYENILRDNDISNDKRDNILRNAHDKLSYVGDKLSELNEKHDNTFSNEVKMFEKYRDNFDKEFPETPGSRSLPTSSVETPEKQLDKIEVLVNKYNKYDKDINNDNTSAEDKIRYINEQDKTLQTLETAAKTYGVSVGYEDSTYKELNNYIEKARENTNNHIDTLPELNKEASLDTLSKLFPQQVGKLAESINEYNEAYINSNIEEKGESVNKAFSELENSLNNMLDMYKTWSDNPAHIASDPYNFNELKNTLSEVKTLFESTHQERVKAEKDITTSIEVVNKSLEGSKVNSIGSNTIEKGNSTIEKSNVGKGNNSIEKSVVSEKGKGKEKGISIGI